MATHMVNMLSDFMVHSYTNNLPSFKQSCFSLLTGIYPYVGDVYDEFGHKVDITEVQFTM